MINYTTCPVCQLVFDKGHSLKVYCGPQCRQKAARLAEKRKLQSQVKATALDQKVLNAPKMEDLVIAAMNLAGGVVSQYLLINNEIDWIPDKNGVIVEEVNDGSSVRKQVMTQDYIKAEQQLVARGL